VQIQSKPRHYQSDRTPTSTTAGHNRQRVSETFSRLAFLSDDDFKI